MSRYALGIDIGGTKVLVGIVDEHGIIAAQHQVATPATEGAEATLAAVIAACRKVLSLSDLPVIAIGVGTAGVVDASGTVVSATSLLKDWAGTRLGDRLRDTFGWPVTVLNDVHATGVCEARIGAAAGRRSVLIVAVGTGIGGAIVRDGVVALGATGIAGSIGHILSPLHRGTICSCGAVDHIECHASGPAIEAEYEARTGEAIDLRAIAARDDDSAKAVIAEAGGALGASIGTAINLLDCELVVVGGGVAGLGAPFLNAVRAGAVRHTLPPARAIAIVSAQHGPDSCMLGAALAALAPG